MGHDKADQVCQASDVWISFDAQKSDRGVQKPLAFLPTAAADDMGR